MIHNNFSTRIDGNSAITGTDDRDRMDTADKCGTDDNEMEQADMANRSGPNDNEMEEPISTCG